MLPFSHGPAHAGPANLGQRRFKRVSQKLALRFGTVVPQVHRLMWDALIAKGIKVPADTGERSIRRSSERV